MENRKIEYEKLICDKCGECAYPSREGDFHLYSEEKDTSTIFHNIQVKSWIKCLCRNCGNSWEINDGS